MINVVFLGCTKFSEQLLIEILKHNSIKTQAIFTIPQRFNISYCKDLVINTNHANLHVYANNLDIPSYDVNSKHGKKITDYKKVISDFSPDVILVLGWYYMVPKSIRELAKYGAWGIHASLLPKYAGGAPLTWAIINGEKETGVTLFKLDNGVDDGDIIKQKSFSIKFKDTIKEVYEKATECSKEILTESLLNIDSIKLQPQNKSRIEVYPQRKPEDGLIDLSWNSTRIYNFIRAQSAPYPGAFIKTSDGKKLIIEKARIE